MEMETAANAKRAPKIPYRSYAECEAKGYADGYAAACADTIIVIVAVIAIAGAYVGFIG